MTLISVGGLLGGRSSEAVAGAETLFLQPGGILADGVTAQLSALIPLDLLSGAGNASSDAGQTSELPLLSAIPGLSDLTGLTSLAGITETVSPAALLAPQTSALHLGDPIISLGESLADLGYDTKQTLVADVVKLPGELTGLGDTNGNPADALYNLGQSTILVGDFVNKATTALSQIADRPLTETANDLILDFHVLIEFATHDLGLTYTIDGLTVLGETIGLGKIGEDNLVTDVLNLPGTLLSGGDVLGSIGHLGGHLPDITDGLVHLLTEIPRDLGSDEFGTGLLGQNGILGGSGLDLANLGDVLGQNGGGPLGAVGGLIDNVTNGLDLVGSNSAGTSNLVTDVLRLPGELLSGQGTPSLTDAGHQLDVTLTATGDLLETVLGTATGGLNTAPTGLLGTLTSALETFGDTGGAAIGVPLAVDGVAATAGSLGLGGDGTDAGGLLAAVTQTVEGALSDVGNDIALAGFGGGAIAIPSLGGSGADSLVGSLLDTGATNASVLPPVADLLQLDAGNDGILSGVTGLLDLDQHHNGSTGGLHSALALI